MDAYLKLLAEAALAATEAEEAADAGAAGVAADALERAESLLAALRAAWPAMGAAERRIVGRTAAPLPARLDRARARLPQRLALSQGAPERDPEEDVDPAQAA